MCGTPPITADQLMRLPDDGFRYELVAGTLTKKPARGWQCGLVASRLLGRLGWHVSQHKLGVTLTAAPGFVLSRDPDTVRVPAIAFIRGERFRAIEHKEGFCPGAPDLAIEVVSPNDTHSEVDEKVKAWLDAGAAMVWVVNPAWRSVTVYRGSTDIKTLTEKDDLDGEDVVPGSRCRVGEIFENL